MQSCNLFHFRSLSRKHIHISQGAVERSLCTNIREIRSLVSTSLPNDFHAFSIPFSIQDSEKMASNTTSSLLIQINSLRRNNNAFTSVIYNALHLISRCSNNRVLSWMKGSRISSITGGVVAFGHSPTPHDLSCDLSCDYSVYTMFVDRFQFNQPLHASESCVVRASDLLRTQPSLS